MLPRTTRRVTTVSTALGGYFTRSAGCVRAIRGFSLVTTAALLWIVPIVSACGGDSDGPTGPTPVAMPAATQSFVSAPPASAPALPAGLDLSAGPQEPRGPTVRGARSVASLSKPVVTQIQRSGTTIGVNWSVSSTTGIVDYRLQWILGNFPFTSFRQLQQAGGAGSVTTANQSASFTPPSGVDPLGRPWKVRVRARRATLTATEQRGGPWSAEVRIPEHVSSDPPPACTVGMTVAWNNTCLAASNQVFHVHSRRRATYEDRAGNILARNQGDVLDLVLAYGFSAEFDDTTGEWKVLTLSRG